MTGRRFTCPYAGLRNSIDNLNSSSAPAGAAQLDCKVISLYKEHTMTTQLGSPGKPADLNPCLHPRSYMKLTRGFLKVAKHHSMTTQSDKKTCCMCSRQKRNNTIRQEMCCMCSGQKETKPDRYEKKTPHGQPYSYLKISWPAKLFD